MKKIIFADVFSALSLSLLAADPGVDQKVLAAFNKTFQNVQEVSWTEFDNSYQVSFKQNTISSKITYDKQGNIVSTIRYYFEEQLPLMILSKVKNKYASQKIHGVVEVSSEQGTFFHITLVNETHWTTIKADAYGNLAVENKFKKA